MARLKEPGIIYYSKACDDVEKKEIKLLRTDCGSDGYWVLECLKSYGHKKWGYYMSLMDWEEVELFATDVCKLPINVVKNAIDICLLRGIFDKEIAEKYQILTSVEMQEVYVEATDSRRKQGTQVEVSGDYWLLNKVEKKNLVIVDGAAPASAEAPAGKSGAASPAEENTKKVVHPKEEEKKALKAEYELLEKEGAKIQDFIIKHRPEFIEPYVDLWNLWAGKHHIYSKPKVQAPSKERKGHFAARIKEDLWDFPKLLSKATKSKLCMSSSWFNFDFLIKNESGYVKLLEGNYDNGLDDAGAGFAPTQPEGPVHPSLSRMEEMLNNHVTL